MLLLRIHFSPEDLSYILSIPFYGIEQLVSEPITNPALNTLGV